MKSLRLILLLGVTAMLAAVVADYFRSRYSNLEAPIAEPEEIPSDLDAQASQWKWSQSSGDERTIELTADSSRQAKDTLGLELTGVELKIFHKDEKTYDRIESPLALFDGRTGQLYSEAAVTVTLGLSLDQREDSTKKPTVIRSTEVTFDSKSGTCSTERHTEYEFDGGTGHSVGAFYDSAHRVFWMKSSVYLERLPGRPGEPPLKIRSGELRYHEREQRIDLRLGASLEHGSQRLDSAEAFVFLEDGDIEHIDAVNAHGVDHRPRKVVTFRAEHLTAEYTPHDALEHINGTGAAEMTSTSTTSRTKVNGHRIDLHYRTPPGATESLLYRAHVRDDARLESHLRSRGDSKPAEIRRVKAGWIQVTMQPDGEDMDRVETLTRGQLELLPQEGSRPKRLLEAERITAYYGARNRLEKVQGMGRVSLESVPPSQREPAEGSGQETLESWSDGLLAEFEPESGELQELKQWNDFRFQRGSRQGKSEEARFDPRSSRLELTGEARVWDPSGSVSAPSVILNEQTGDLTADGGVSSIYQEPPSSRSDEGTEGEEFFTPAEPAFATATRMVFEQESGLIHYEGEARLWQGQDRIEADDIRIQRLEKTLAAKGNVVSFLRSEQEGSAEPGRTRERTPPPMMRISGDSMWYDGPSRKVIYKGGVELRRASLTVKSEQLEGFLRAAEEEESNQLKKAVALGDVGIIQQSEADRRVRQGFGQRATYQPATQKVHLEGAPARLVNESGSETRGAELTYHVNDDRLLVLGNGEERTYSLRRRQSP